MKNYRILVIAAAALALCACQEKESLAPQKQAIRFTTNLGAYTKATDTNFEEGDAVSLFAEAPINALNVRMVCRGGELVPETPVYWKEDQPVNQYTGFFAVYPYREDWEDLSDLSVFSVNADQRTHELYTASDLLGAAYMAYPDCETVPLNFTHRLCRLIVEVNSYGSDLSVADVYLKDTYGKVRVTIAYRMNVETVGAKGTIRMGKWDNNRWSAIVPPQYFDFPVVVVMEDGSMYEFSPASWNSEVYLESAKSYTAQMQIDKETETISGSIAVENWTPDNDAAFGNYIADEYHSEGWWYIKEVNSDDYQDLIYNSFNGDHFEAGVNAAAGVQYELVYQIGRRELTFGLENTASASVGGEYILKENGSPFAFSASGEFVVKVFPYTNRVLVEADDEVWSVVGDFGDDPWNTDLDMVRESSGVYSIDFESYGQEFKLRANHGWEKNLGKYNNNPMEPGHTYYVYYDGYNITLTEAGKYHLELDSRNCILSVELLESYVSEDLYGSIQGSWIYQDGDNTFTWTITPVEYPDYQLFYLASDYEFYINASLDKASAKLKVGAQRLGEWTWGNYGLVYDYILAHSGNYNYYLQEDGAVVFYMEKTADGSILVTPGKSKDATVYDSFEFYIMLQDDDYYGYTARYGDVFPLPMTWSPAN